MKILVISNLYPPHHIGGYELYCRRMVEALRAQGHTTHVLTSDHGSSEGCPGLQRALRIHGLFGHPWLPLPRLLQLERHNNRVLQNAIRDLRPDVVFGWNFSGLSKSMLLTLGRTGIPTVFCVCDHWIARGSDADVWINWWNRPADSAPHQLARRAAELTGLRQNRVLPPSDSMRHIDFRGAYFCSRALRELTAAALPTFLTSTSQAETSMADCKIIHCSTDVERFNGLPKPIEAPLQRLLFVGRLHPDKGPMTALRAMAWLRDKFHGSLSIYGRGEPLYEAELKNYVKSNALPVTFHEATPEEMPAIYAQHDALLFTSEWAEPFAITPLEAMSSGLPVISTMTGGSSELFRHRENAMTFRAGDDGDLALQVLALERDRALRARLAATGRKEVRERCAEPVILRQTEEHLAETIRVWKT
ncbi:MAG TPA: glycosyltransferase family 4 protein [Verrucomicrobiae bacterium]|jgi:glycosyltransferase involved in cell wall biosynthesis|nr:glycosyltransferase family 4 protein [Verrucomicrobiae bacterium]